jgi:hypothetical protein
MSWEGVAAHTVDSGALEDHAFRLFDDDPAGQRAAELFVDLLNIGGGALSQDADRGEVGEGAGDQAVSVIDVETASVAPPRDMHGLALLCSTLVRSSPPWDVRASSTATSQREGDGELDVSTRAPASAAVRRSVYLPRE